ncbi:MAG: DUF1444 family protein [Acidobacteriota bacterium]
MSENAREIESVLALLRRDDVGRDAVALLFVKLAGLRFPELRTEFVSDDEIKITDAAGKSSSVYLRNLWIECEQKPEERVELVDRFVRAAMPDTTAQQDQAIDAQRVVALVKDSQYREFLPEEDRASASRHLAGDLWIMFALDLPDSTVSLNAKQVAQLGLDGDVLLRLGTENVSDMLSEMSFEPFSHFFTISCANLYYASSVLLLDYVWPQAAELVDGDVVVVVPARDTVLFAGSNNAAGLEELRMQAHHVVTNGHHVISETLLRRVDGAWKLFS